ncbi:MAG TPA: iron-sulfur cluster repair di-iron protein [Hyphomicrobium sp.]|nr:iron-sulfur cluster repair di-iron protein [Hyphomicrobium sp.]
MNELFAHDRTVGEIAATLAGATAIFRRHKIDFCCGGNVPLDEAAQSRGVKPEVLRAELAELAQASPDVPDDPVALVDHIVARYHDVHRRELPELTRLARRVEAVHRAHEAVPAGLADVLEAAQQELEEHMQKEEQIIFPAIRSGYRGTLFAPIKVMRHEHDGQARIIHALQACCHDFDLPEDACRSWQALYAGVEKLVTDLTEHIHLENNILFPRFE